MKAGFVLSLGPARTLAEAPTPGMAALHEDPACPATFSGPGYRLSAHDALPILPIGDHGHVVGTVFRRGSQTPITSFAEAEAAAIRASDGGWLIDRCWGGWAAVLAATPGRSAAVLRDGSPAFPVFYATAGDVDHYASDGRRLVAADMASALPDPDYARVALAWPGLRHARTGIAGVEELLPGQRRRRVGNSHSVAERWSPWHHASRERAITDRTAAVELVRSEVLACVAAWARCSAAPLLELSGGLDSSIIAAALHHAGINARAITFATSAADGDERRFARTVADRAGLTLDEVIALPETPLLARRERTLRPGTHPALAGIDAALAACADKIGADALLSGTGGDNVFCYIHTASPVLDVLRSPPSKPSAWSILSDLAIMHQTSTWHVARSAWRRARRPPSPRRRHAADMITADAAATPCGHHAWLEPPSNSLAGKLDHVRALLRIQDVLDTNDRGAFRPMQYPLLSQPLVEACLRVPTWLWTEGGRDRAVARAAFADLLPKAVLERRTKGRLETQSLQLYLANRVVIRDLLLTGWLAAERIADRGAIERYTANADPPRDDRYFRLFDLLGMELWARAWLD